MSAKLCRLEDTAHFSIRSSKCSKWFLSALDFKGEFEGTLRLALNSIPLRGKSGGETGSFTPQDGHFRVLGAAGQSSFEMLAQATRND